MAKAPRETLSVSDFKATCLAVLERVRRTGRPVLITKRGKPLAEVIPPSAATIGSDWLGSLRGAARLAGDVVGPVATPDDWDALGP
jgi:prevent-host-death family protein